MPVMDDGLTSCDKKWWSGRGKCEHSIIAVTADVIKHTKSRVAEIGMNHYI
jgi:CheY-like chemotaxis protein